MSTTWTKLSKERSRLSTALTHGPVAAALSLVALNLVLVLPAQALPIDPNHVCEGFRDLFLHAWLSVDVVLLGTVAIACSAFERQRLGVVLASVLYAVVFLYETYEVFVLRVFRLDVLVYDQTFFFKDAAALLARQTWIIDLSMVGAAMAAIFMLVVVVPAFFGLVASELSVPHLRRRVVSAAIIAVAVILLTHTGPGVVQRDGAVQSTTARIVRNLVATLEHRASRA